MLLKLISCGNLAPMSVLVVTLLQGLRQHNQCIYSLQERIDQLEEGTHTEPSPQRLTQPKDGCDAGTHGDF